MGCGSSVLPEADPSLMRSLTKGGASRKVQAVDMEAAITVLAVIRPLLDFEKKKGGKEVVKIVSDPCSTGLASSDPNPPTRYLAVFCTCLRPKLLACDAFGSRPTRT